jgi:ribosomal protein L24
MRVAKDDTVKIIAGNDRGKTGKVLKVYPDKERIIVEGVNFIKRHTKARSRMEPGGIIEKEARFECAGGMPALRRGRAPQENHACGRQES